jgi:hypothetical protein
VDIKHQKLTHGDRCPECSKGNLYGQKEPKVLLRIIGQAPLAPTVYSLERLRCGACGQVFSEPYTNHRLDVDETYETSSGLDCDRTGLHCFSI